MTFDETQQALTQAFRDNTMPPEEMSEWFAEQGIDEAAFRAHVGISVWTAALAVLAEVHGAEGPAGVVSLYVMGFMDGHTIAENAD